MSQQINTLSRRNFLKGAACASALSVGGLSSVALANSAIAEQYIESGTITLVNQNSKSIVLDAKQPISLENKNGWIVVNVNKASTTGSARVLNLDAGQKLSFAVQNGSTPTLITNSNENNGIHSTVFVGNDDFPASLYHATFA